MTDEELYLHFLSEGSSDDIQELLKRYRESLTLFIYGYVHNMDDAEELMLDAFAVAASGTARYHRKSSFKTWLFAIAKNQAFHFLRKQKQRRERFYEEIPSAEGASLASSDDMPEMKLLQEEKNRQLYAALERVHPDYRQALYLIYFEEMSVEEAGQIMKKSKKQMYNLVHRGKQSLKEKLEELGASEV